MILAAVYLLWAFQRAFTGEPEGDNATLKEINGRELATVVPLLALSLFLGFYPKPLFDRTQPAVKQLVQHIEQTTGHREPKPQFQPAHAPASAQASAGAALGSGK